MRTLLALLLALLLLGCGIFHDGGVDLGALADQVALARQDVQDFAYLATPETQAKLAQLAPAVEKVEAALRSAAAGGPVDDAYKAADAALTLADAVLAELPQDNDLRVYVLVGRALLRRLAAGQPEAAADAEAVHAEAAVASPHAEEVAR